MPIWKAMVLSAAALMLAGCAKELAKEAAAAPVADVSEITPNAELRARLKLGEPEMAEVGEQVTVSARVEVDETRVARVGSPVMGRVTALMVREGQDVKKGDLLALLNSTGLSVAQLEYLKAMSQRQLAQRGVERAQQLLKAEVIGVAELQRREAELTQASAELDGARVQLELLGMAPEAIEELSRTRRMGSVSRVVANMDGTVLVRRIALGQVVEAAATVVEIADLSNVWLVAEVPEPNAGRLMEGQGVEASIAALPGLALHGKLSFVSRTLNPETRTVQVRMDVENRGGRLKPAMLATMKLLGQREKRQVVPVTAVVREGNDETVYVERAPGVYAMRAVKLGEEYGKWRVLEEGVSAGERIVTEGAFHLNNERRRRAVRGSGSE